MKTTKEFKDYILEQLDLLDKITCRPMMGEYLLYNDGVLFGGIYNNRLLIKKAKTNESYELEEQIPYDGAKPMLIIKDLENKDLIKNIVLDTCKGLISK